MANSGWTAALIAPNQRTHDASQSAVTHASFGPPVMQANAPAPSTSSNTALAAQVLRDPSLGSRVVGGVSVPKGTAVGTGSVSAAGDIPPAVQAAIQDFGRNQSTQTTIDILNKVLGAFNAPAGQQGIDPIQAQYLQSKTALNNQLLQQQQLPGRISQRINQLESQKPAVNPFVISPMGQYAGGSGAQNIDRELQNLYGERTNAQRASGWLPSY